MEDQNKNINKKQLWFGYFMAIPVYFFVAYQYAVYQSKTFSFKLSDLNDYWFLGLFLIGVIEMVVLYKYANKYMDKAESKEREKNLWMIKVVASIVPAILGLMLFLMHFSFMQMSVMCLVSLIGMKIVYPDKEE